MITKVKENVSEIMNSPIEITKVDAGMSVNRLSILISMVKYYYCLGICCNAQSLKVLHFFFHSNCQYYDF